MIYHYFRYMKRTNPVVAPPESVLEHDGQEFTRMFVYGILKSTETNMMVRPGGFKTGSGFLEGYAMYDGGVAVVSEGTESDRSYGEIWEVPIDYIHSNIDPLEGGYTRTWIPDQFGGVWVYLQEPWGGGPKIENWSSGFRRVREF